MSYEVRFNVISVGNFGHVNVTLVDNSNPLSPIESTYGGNNANLGPGNLLPDWGDTSEGVIADDGRIVHVDGSVITVEAERIVYSEETSHLHEQHAMLKTWTSGGLAMAPEHVEGWRTYNFTVAEHHSEQPVMRLAA